MAWRLTLAALGLALYAPASAVAHDSNGFVERDVRVLQTWHGVSGGYLGWAVSELTDIDRDGVTDVIAGEPYANSQAGVTWVFSGRTGRTLHRFPGAPGDFQGGAIADAGDTDRDGVHDIISGAYGSGGPGKAYLYSGRTGRLLYTWQGAQIGDQFGSAVASAGDQNRDGYDDVIVGAKTDDVAGLNAGAAYVFSGRTHQLLRRLDGRHPGALFGTAADWTESVDHGRQADLIVGAAAENGGGGAHVFSGGFGGRELFALAPPPAAVNFGDFFVAGVGRVDGDRIPDIYAADYGAAGGNGWAGVYSGRDGSPIWAWPGGPGDGRGPGREAGDVDHDGRIDLAVGAYTSGPTGAGRVDIFSGATGRALRTFTSTTAGEQLGFDAVGLGDVNRDGEPDLLLSAAEGDTVYLVAGRSRRGGHGKGDNPG